MPPTVPLRACLRRHRYLLLALFCALVVFALAFLSPISYAGSDSFFTLVVSQAILDKGTIRLDDYVDRLLPTMERVPYDIVWRDGHAYQIYPLGTPLFSLPFVWAANLLGRDMAIVDHNYRLQNDLSALLCALIFLILYRLGLYYVSPRASLLVALVSVLGSALVSTVGTALWGVDWAVLFLVLSLWLLVRIDTATPGRGRTPRRAALGMVHWAPYLLGATLFAAYLCRPAVATFIAAVLAYLLLAHRDQGLKAALTALGLLLLLAGFNWFEFGQLLPDYYFRTPLGWLRGRHLAPRMLEALVTLLVLCGIYLWLTRRRHRPALLAAALLLLLGGMAWLWFRSGSPLPDLRPALQQLRLGRPGLGTAFYGAFLSPGRGLLVYSPFLLPVLLGSLLFWQDLAPARLAAVAWLSFVLHLLALVSTGAWQGGHAFGARLLTDVLPALALLTLLLWRALSIRPVPTWARIGATCYLLLGLFAVLVNTYQGLLNPNTVRWNGEMAPDVVSQRHVVFDWRYPQFLATSRSLCARNLEYLQGRLQEGHIPLAAYRLGDAITYTTGTDGAEPQVTRPGEPGGGAGGRFADDNQLFLPLIQRPGPNALFIGWLPPRDGFRWSACRAARIVFAFGDVPAGVQEAQLQLTAGSLGAQRVALSLNGVHLGDLDFPGPDAPPVSRTLSFPAALLRPHAPNELAFSFPDASSPDRGDDRTLSLAFRALRIDTAE
jgi:hypothetical protein